MFLCRDLASKVSNTKRGAPYCTAIVTAEVRYPEITPKKGKDKIQRDKASILRCRDLASKVM